MILLLRHGQTAFNAERRLQGHLDAPLNMAPKICTKRDLIALLTHHKPLLSTCYGFKAANRGFPAA
ncbi:MAG: histidine phosphatase family protein [Cypionkella sp.]|jgi:bisphosphoglycerate-dependent phosphoglycerate mutase|nr:histidine phosphatase family protein [Cypionkella sp.]